MSASPDIQRRYAVIGTGALGGFYGARLQRAGFDVHFLLHRDYEHVMQHGLVIKSLDGDFVLPQVQAYQDVNKMPLCEVVIVALKTTQNHLLPKLLPPLVGQNSVVLLLQNGLGVEAQIAEMMDTDRVIGGMCFICSNKVAPGHIRHLDYKKITLGEYAAQYARKGITQRMEELASDFAKADIPIELTDDLLQARWQKLVWNIPFNGLSVVLNARTDEMMANPAIRSLAEQLMREVLTGATACNRIIPESFIEQMLDHTAKMKPYRTSMKIDYDEGRPLEVEAIFGAPLRMAQQAGTQLPRIQMLYQQLQFLDARNQATS